jgi:maleylpyruvate isomerase
MCSSREQRNADIQAGAKLSGEQLTGWFEQSARELAMAMAALPAEAWQAEVVTAQGGTVPATETPWMRLPRRAPVLRCHHTGWRASARASPLAVRR